MEGHNVSLAGTRKDYIMAQARVVQSNPAVLNVQVPGIAGGNRAYGAAFRVKVSAACAEFVSHECERPSLAETGRLYATVQLRSRGEGRLNLQIAGTGPGGNRDYGFAEEVSCTAGESMLLASVQDVVAPEAPSVVSEVVTFKGLEVADLGGLSLGGFCGFLSVSTDGVTVFLPDVTIDDLIRQ